MTAILTALGSGVSAQKILEWIMRKAPALAPKITKSLAAGISADKVLSFFSKDKNFQRLREEMEQVYPKTNNAANPLVQAQMTRDQNLGTDMASGLKRQLPGILGGAAGLAGSLALNHALPNQLKGSMPGIAEKIQQTPQTPPISPVSPASIPQSAPAIQPEQIATNVSEILNKHGLKKHVDIIHGTYKDPKEVAAILYNRFPKEMKEFQKEVGKPMENAIADYLQIAQPDIQKAPEQLAQQPALAQPAPEQQPIVSPAAQIAPPEPAKAIEKTEELPEEKPKIEKGNIVASPNGVGEVKEIRNGQALIDVDGKMHKVDKNELEAEPEEVKTAKFDFDPKDIPEDLRSAPLNEVYTPSDRRHVTVKYNQGLKPVRYIYWRKDGKSVPEQFIDKIKQGVQLPVSSGLSFWGAWDANKADSRGAANHQELVKNAQEEGEPDDPSKEYWFIKEESIYTHPYVEKTQEFLREQEKKFNEERKAKKPKKKRS